VTDESRARLLVRSEADVEERTALGAVHFRQIFTEESAAFESSLTYVLRNRIAEGEENTRHVHDDVEKVYYILSGTAAISCGDERAEARAGDFIFFPAAVPHSIRSCGPGDLEFIVCAARTLDRPVAK
jgi:mannose-6-phosphate isomerase-like protein (cupin superfamily)